MSAAVRGYALSVVSFFWADLACCPTRRRPSRDVRNGCHLRV